MNLFWIPLGAGAGGSLVRVSGRLFEALAAAFARRPPQALFHSALEVHVDGARTTVEMAPVWTGTGDRGVVSEGPVGARFLGRFRLFRYEIRRWRGGSIPDLAAAVGGAVAVSRDRETARMLLDLIPEFPCRTWGRDELGTGDMWNSNSLVSWLLVRAGIDTSAISPPHDGRAPGWVAGVAVASRARGDSAT